MLPFLQSQLAGASGKNIVDLCLDYALVAELHPEKFTEISGLELFPALEELSIAMHDLRVAEGLGHLECLQRLDLSHNALEGLGEIVRLRSLQWLDLSHNALENLHGIEALGALEELQVGFNLLHSVAEFAHLPELKTLVMNGNRHLQRLDGLPPSLEALHLAKCFVQDFSALAHLKRMQLLTVSPGSMAGLEILSDLPKLDALHIQATRMHGRLALPLLNALRKLKITNALQILALDSTADMPHLEQLEIHHSQLAAPPSLSHFPNLKTLEIKFSPLTNLDGIAELAQLEMLKLEGSQIPQQALSQLKKVRPDLEIKF